MRKETFKLIRLYSEMTQKEFAEYIGVSRGTISLIELGQRSVTPAVRAKLAAKSNLDDSYFEYIEKYHRLSQ